MQPSEPTYIQPCKSPYYGSKDIVDLDHDGRAIRVGEAIFNTPVAVDYSSFVRVVCSSDVYWAVPKYWRAKHVNRSIQDMYGYPPKVLYKWYRGFHYKHFIAPKKKWIDRLCWTSHGLSTRKVMTLNAVWPIIREAESDGNENIIPLIFHIGIDPKRLKKYYGKAIWKRLCKKTFNWNKGFCENFGAIKAMFELAESTTQAHIKRIKASRGVPDYFLRDQPGCMRAVIDWTRQFGYNTRQIITLVDTLSMATNVMTEPEINAYYSRIAAMPYALVEAEHNRLQTEVRPNLYKKVYDIDVDKCIPEVVKPDEFSLGEFKVVAITSHEDLINESNAMDHCVAYAYARLIATGNYIAYRLFKNDVHYGTFGVTRKESGHWAFSQAYDKGNAHNLREILGDEFVEGCISHINQLYR